MRCAKFQPLSTKIQCATNPIIKRCQHHYLASFSTHVSPHSHVMLEFLARTKACSPVSLLESTRSSVRFLNKTQLDGKVPVVPAFILRSQTSICMFESFAGEEHGS